jgi:hypothetical protein
VETGEIVHANGANGGVADFMELEHTLAASFRERLGQLLPGVVPALPAVTRAVAAAHPLDAALALSEGLIALDNHELPRARDSFQKALADDPRMEAARTQLAALEL